MIKKSQEHLNSVNESYAEHMSVAFKVSSKMIASGFMALIHGLYLQFSKEKQAIE